jgi:peptide/nickel transport system permease protein
VHRLGIRLGQAVLTYTVAVTLAFVLMRLTPGDPIPQLDDQQRFTAEQAARLRALYGLDRPILEQYGTFLSGAFRGDLGSSIRYGGRPVTQLLRERLPASLLLGGLVLVINFTVGTWLGAWQAIRAGSRFDLTTSALSLVLYAVPSFWLGTMLAWLFAVTWHLLPAAGMHDPSLTADAGLAARAFDLVRHLVLPALTLSAVSIASAMRLERSSMMEVLRLDFIRAARARGLSEERVIWRHAFRNALGPLLTLLGLWLPILVTGSVFVEYVFGWPGLGLLASEAISSRDYPLIMGTTLLAAALVIAGGLVSDLLHGWLDPRVRAL